jgi:hypothetical protein
MDKLNAQCHVVIHRYMANHDYILAKSSISNILVGFRGATRVMAPQDAENHSTLSPSNIHQNKFYKSGVVKKENLSVVQRLLQISTNRPFILGLKSNRYRHSKSLMFFRKPYAAPVLFCIVEYCEFNNALL